jgi:hypothetical protein
MSERCDHLNRIGCTIALRQETDVRGTVSYICSYALYSLRVLT